MNKSRITLLSVMAVLCLAGCGENDNGGGKKPTPKPSNDFTLIDPTDTSQLSENCKKYVDDMRAQEEANGEENKYMMDGYAFRPTDNVKIDAKNDDGSWVYRDAIDYNDEEKRVEQQSQKSDRSKGVPLKFSLNDGYSADSYKIQVSTDENFAEGTVIEVAATPDTEVRVKNLFQNTDYYWKVVTDNSESDVKTFTTGDYPRWIEAADLFNVRDAGGYMTSSGKRVKQGLIYRGGEIAINARGGGDGAFSQTKHQKTATPEAKEIFRNVMKIGNELDLRGDSDLNADNYHSCYFAEKDENGKDDIVWTNVVLSSWENFLTNKKNIQDCFEAFAHADEKPVYYHCHGGADRTGTLGLFLLGALGVSYSDIVIDYELTSYSSIIAMNKTTAADSLRRHYQRGTYDHWNEFIPSVEKTAGWDKSKTLQENIVNFLVNVAEVPQATIDRYQSIMLED